MSHCPHCGGVVGRDCFNVEECSAITQEIERRGMIDAELEPLRAQLEAERAAHAAEVARLRSELSAAHESFEEIYCGNAQCESKYGGCDQSCKREAYRASQRTEAALAAPPTAAAQAIEGMRKALEPFKRFANNLDSPPNWVPDGCPINTDAGGISDFSVAQVRQARAALAAWEEATRG